MNSCFLDEVQEKEDDVFFAVPCKNIDGTISYQYYKQATTADTEECKYLRGCLQFPWTLQERQFPSRRKNSNCSRQRSNPLQQQASV